MAGDRLNLGGLEGTSASVFLSSKVFSGTICENLKLSWLREALLVSVIAKVILKLLVLGPIIGMSLRSRPVKSYM